MLALLLAAQTVAVPAPAAAEMRGLWVVRTGLVSAEAVDRVVDAAAAAGFNALFVQVRGRGDAFYASRLVARSPLLPKQPAEFDPLARLLERARTRGLDVHAWVNVLLSANFSFLAKDSIVSLHPEWLMVPRAAARETMPADGRGLLWLVREKSRGDSDVEGYYLSPSSPGAVQHLEAVVRELTRGYQIRGLHLDFIRYPGPDYDYSVAALEGFRKQQKTGNLLGGPSERPAAWEAYRLDTLSELAARLARAAREERPGLLVSAAVVPDQAAALRHKFQDWPGWLASGILDAVCPMTYTPDEGIFREQVAEARTRAGAGRGVWAGIGAYRLTPSEIVLRITESREAGASGFVLFSNESLDAAVISALRAEIATAGAARSTSPRAPARMR